jgi:hypothetical protein
MGNLKEWSPTSTYKHPQYRLTRGGQIITVQITTDTEFTGSIAAGISQILIGHVAQGEVFLSTSETVWVEADLPPGF